MAAKAVREDILNHMAKALPDYFKDDTNPTKTLMAYADKKCSERDEEYLAKTCSQFELPLFDVPTNVHNFD